MNDGYTNYIIITNSHELHKIMDEVYDKLAVLFFYTCKNQNCKKAMKAFEKVALMHNISCFFTIDMDKFTGDSKYVQNINNMPTFDCYYMGTNFSSFSSFLENEIDIYVKKAEQYTINMMKNNQMGQMNQMAPVNQMAPTVQYMQKSFCNPGWNNMPNSMPNSMPNNMPNSIPNSMPNSMLNNIPNNIQNIMSPPSNMLEMPTSPENLQKMFQLFHMMQSLGMLAPPVLETKQNSDTIPYTSGINMEMGKTYVLPSGDKIIVLSDGKYGLIKK